MKINLRPFKDFQDLRGHPVNIFCVIIICWPSRLCIRKGHLKIRSHKRWLGLKIRLCHKYEGPAS